MGISRREWLQGDVARGLETVCRIDLASERERLEAALECLRRESGAADACLAAAVDEARGAEDRAYAEYQQARARRSEAERQRTEAKSAASRRERAMQVDSEALQVGRLDRLNDDLAAAWQEHRRRGPESTTEGEGTATAI